MKIQDLAFLIGLFSLLTLVKSWRWFVLAGLACLVLSFFTFQLGILFTAERLTWYAGAFILIGIVKKNNDLRITK